MAPALSLVSVRPEEEGGGGDTSVRLFAADKANADAYDNLEFGLWAS